MSNDQQEVALLLSVHPSSVAATRLRGTQYAPHFAAAGLQLRHWSFLSESDLRFWYGQGHVGRVLALLHGVLRLPSLLFALRGVHVAIVQREALPLGPPVLELLVGRGRRLVWDVDDAVWEQFTSPTAGRVPQWLRATGDKYAVLCRRADEVWAGSEVLAQWCRQHSDRVHVVPTVVPVAADRPVTTAERTVGWVGSHSTGPFLEGILPAVSGVTPPPEVLVVGARVQGTRELTPRVAPWSQETEDSALARTRVGLYPIDRGHPLAEGKCGLKAILYMSHGIPSVVTPTASNAEVVRHGIEGLHANRPEDWTARIQELLDDPERWEAMSVAAHRRARENYSLETWGPRLAARLRALVGTA